MLNISVIEMFVFIISNGNISDIVGKRGRILGVAIFIFNISFQNVSYVLVKTIQWGATI